jgi:hypothetical protein
MNNCLNEKYWTKEYLNILSEAETYEELLTCVAIPLLKDMKKDYTFVYISLGCMTTGGIARRKFGYDIDAKLMYRINIDKFKSIQSDISKYINSAILFDQTVFEDAFMRINSVKQSWDLLIKEFYWKIFRLGIIDGYILQPYWYESSGTQDEVKMVVTFYKPRVLELNTGFFKMTVSEKKDLFQKLQWTDIINVSKKLR